MKNLISHLRLWVHRHTSRWKNLLKTQNKILEKLPKIEKKKEIGKGTRRKNKELYWGLTYFINRSINIFYFNLFVLNSYFILLFDMEKVYKKKALSRAVCRWKNFKNRLTSKYILWHRHDLISLKRPIKF